MLEKDTLVAYTPEHEAKLLKKADKEVKKLRLNNVRAVSKDTWKPIHSKILLLTQRNLTDKEIAKQVKISFETVGCIRQSPYFRQRAALVGRKIALKLEEKGIEALITDKARAKIQQASLRAAMKVLKIMKKGLPVERIQLDAAKDVLDRAGLKPVDIVETRQRAYTPEEIASTKETLLEVETITQRLTNQTSRHIVKLPGGPVTDESSENVQQEEEPLS